MTAAEARIFTNLAIVKERDEKLNSLLDDMNTKIETMISEMKELTATLEECDDDDEESD